MFRRRRSAEDFAMEIDAHIELETERLVGEGLEPDAARRAASRAFGNRTSAMERFHESGRPMWLDRFVADVRVSARSLARYPVACAVAVVSLGGGIGATTVTLAARDAIFRRAPLHYRDPGQLSRVQVGTPDRPIRPSGSLVPGPLARIWSDGATAWELAGTSSLGPREVKAGDRTVTLPVRGATPNLFAVVGVPAALGQTFTEARNVADDATPVVLSHGAWQRLFDGRSDVTGAAIWIEGRPYAVIGVMPERFWYSAMDPAVWTPLDAAALQAVTGLDTVVRRRSDVTPEQLETRLHSGLEQYIRALPADRRDLRTRVSGIEGTPLGRAVSIVLPWLLGACVLLTLLIACANVATLVIAQWTAREREISIRAALGASRGRIVRLLVTESLIIAGLGGGVGICATIALFGMMARRAGPYVRYFDLSIAPSVFAQVCVITLASGIAAGLAPALFETRRLQHNPMRPVLASERGRQRARHVLVALEIAVTVALLVVTATMLDGYRRTLNADLGFATKPLVALRVDRGAGVAAAPVIDALRRVPTVTAAAPSTSIPYMASGRLQSVLASDAVAATAEHAPVGAAFFSTLGVAMRAGREFTDRDVPRDRVAIVNEQLARTLWPGRDPLGQTVQIGSERHEVIGVVADYRVMPFQTEQQGLKIYTPMSQDDRPASLTFLVRTGGSAPDLAAALRRDLPKALPGSGVSQAFAVDEVMRIAGQEILVGTAPLVPLIATALLLTAVGVYGVLAFAVTRRSRELAVRAAVGATGRDLLRLVAGHSARLVIAGIVAGLGGTFTLVGLMRANGGGGSMFDPSWPALVVPAAVVMVVAALASWVPSRRARRVDPAILLRAV